MRESVDGRPAVAEGLEELHRLIAPRFARAEPRRRALGYVRGLLESSYK